jgi:hypothetical protein
MAHPALSLTRRPTHCFFHRWLVTMKSRAPLALVSLASLGSLSRRVPLSSYPSLGVSTHRSTSLGSGASPSLSLIPYSHSSAVRLRIPRTTKRCWPVPRLLRRYAPSTTSPHGTLHQYTVSHSVEVNLSFGESHLTHSPCSTMLPPLPISRAKPLLRGQLPHQSLPRSRLTSSSVVPSRPISIVG